MVESVAGEFEPQPVEPGNSGWQANELRLESLRNHHTFARTMLPLPSSFCGFLFDILRFLFGSNLFHPLPGLAAQCTESLH